MAKVKIGDMFELVTPKGKAYLHYIYKDKSLGDLIRVLPGIYHEEPIDYIEIAKQKELYLIFFPLSAAYKRNLVKQVAHYDDNNFQKPKFMREKHVIHGEFKGWYIVDTDSWNNQFVTKLTDEEKLLSPWGIWNDSLLIDRIVEGWTLEKWV
ncbi:MAG TPA: hypothetical protein PKM65_19115 [Spirochaetota bacterium]|nr:hypothetical protein [Spirochaetota bacterium]HNT11379.1 hypothetical protein [Spirochaetota bacterium]